MSTEYVRTNLNKAHELDPATFVRELLLSSQFTDASGTARLRFWRSEWWHYADGRYRLIPDAEFAALLVQEVNARCCRLSRGALNNFIDQMKAVTILPGSVEAPCWFGEAPHNWQPGDLLIARNGILHLPSWAAGHQCWLASTPQLFATTALDYDIGAAATAPRQWLAFLEEVLPDEESRNTLQDWAGYLLTADTSQQKILLAIGPTRSGRGTVIRVLRRLIGEANCAGPTLDSLGTQFGLQQLLHKTLAVVADARIGRQDSAVIVERLLSITGEDALTIPRKHRDSIETTLRARFILVSNELPRLTDASGAIANRIVILRFPNSFLGREDTSLTNNLLTELPGILLWALEGWRRLRERGRLVQPPAAAELVEDLAGLTSPIRRFVTDCCFMTAGTEWQPQLTTTKPALYQAWVRWANENGYRPGSAETFGRNLAAAFPTIRSERPRIDDGGGPRPRVYVGIGLRGGIGSPVDAGPIGTEPGPGAWTRQNGNGQTLGLTQRQSGRGA
jgi:putative DNA primase/helicase